METNEPINTMPNAQSSEAINAMQQRLEENRLKLLDMEEAMRKTKDALHKVQNEIEDLKKSGGRL